MIHEHGPVKGTGPDQEAIRQARALGLIAHDDQRRWALTPMGRDWCEGRVRQVEVRPGGRRFVATWLKALPRILRA